MDQNNESDELSATAPVPNDPAQLPFGEPSQIGRYRVIRLLGKGGFGRVYLAHDDELDRPVAIKVPNRERVSSPRDLEAYLTEAKILAKLEHPNIVPVYDAGRSDDGLCYVVSKFLDGCDLAVRIRRDRPGFRESAELIVVVAEALHYAHTRGLVHRDIKPANILIDSAGKPCVADFGIALRDEDFGTGAGLAGTAAYMSPEQARGEGHRVDGRSDIFNLGVVFYELLTGRRPFRGDSQQEIMEQIISFEPRPLRQIDDAIPKELERICSKALSKRASERYSTAKDLAEDIQSFLQTPGGTAAPVAVAVPVSIPSGSTLEAVAPPPTCRETDSDQRPIRIVPKGLRSFDLEDADFFLELLPGPRDRDGLPESIRFWKRKIEQIDPDMTFKVGLIYGPSGCGKSSLVKAGLLPRLRTHVYPVYIEATSEETEARLKKGLRKACSDLPHGVGLVDSLAHLRRGRMLPAGRKVLLVLDQFEQWLFGRRGEENTELVAALRHCDGEHIQAVVLVRDDFWLAASRFMRDLEIRLVEGENSALVDLFDPRHAEKVLMAFGRAYGALPEKIDDLTGDQKSFLDQSISGLAQDGKIVSVRLALFAEMVKGKPWGSATLKEVGGTEGVGVTFLEETFSASTAPPEHRFHQKAAQAVLKALLPETGADIKGQMRSRQELLEASGHADRPGDFEDLIHILDAELRLITPTDAEGSASEGHPTPPSGRYYQLTHDYLVHSLRDWLTRKQRETRKGRAELRLTERSSLWNAKPENRLLPSALEWANIRLLTRRRDWTEQERRMMRRAEWEYGLRSLAAVLLLGLLTWGGIEGYGDLKASALVESLKTAGTADVAQIVKQIAGYRRWADSRLARLLSDSEPTSREHFHASLALLPVDPRQADYLSERLLAASPSDVAVLREALRPHQASVLPRLWEVVAAAKLDDPRLLASASALALYDPKNDRWKQAGPTVSDALVGVNAVSLGGWTELLRPVRKTLTPRLASIFRDARRSESERSLATNLLFDYAGDEPDVVADLLMVADAKPYSILFPIAQRQTPRIVPLFQAEITKQATYEWDDPPLDASWMKPDLTSISRIESAQGMVDDRFAFCQTMPLDEFLTSVETLRKSGYRPIRFRPFADLQEVRVAAVWARDGRNWRIGSGLSPEQASGQADKSKNDEFLPVDVAGYVAAGEDGKPTDRYAAIWVEKTRPDEEAQVEVGAKDAEHQATKHRLKAGGMTLVATHVMRATDGRNRFCGVWQKLGASKVPPYVEDLDETELAGVLARNAGSTLIDLCVAAAVPPPTANDRATANVKAVETAIKAKPDDPNARFSRAVMNAGYLDRRYAAVWTSGVSHDVTPIYGLDPAAHLERCQEVGSQGYRIRSVSLVRTRPEGPLVSASIWHRPSVSEDVKDELARHQARAAVALVRLGKAEEVFPLLRHSSDPRLRSFILNWLGPLGADPKLMAAELDRINSSASARRRTPDADLAATAGLPTVDGGQQPLMDAILFHPETSMRRALILALGTFGADGLSPGEREPLLGKLLALYRNDPDAGIHGAVKWTLRQWKQPEKLLAVDAELSKLKDKGKRRWYVNRQGQTFIIVEGPVEFRMGSPSSEPDRTADETPHRRVIPRRFAIADKEVNVEHYQRFVRENPQFGLDQSYLDKYSSQPDGPMIYVNWFGAAAYCNWLSEQDGLPKTNWCYLANAAGQYAEGMTIPANVLERSGYRLPTEAEWEAACRAGTLTSRYHGVSIDLLGSYAGYLANSSERAWPCGSLLPNDLGLFDMLGNVYEWCHDASGQYRLGDMHNTDNIMLPETVHDRNPRLLRGGSFSNQPAYVRSAVRGRNTPSIRSPNSGFRPARTYP